MLETKLTKVGNSMAVLLPKSFRQEASIEDDEALYVASPRKGVIVITSVVSGEDRLASLEKAQKRISSRAVRIAPWPEDMTADDLIAKGKEGAANELLLS